LARKLEHKNVLIDHWSSEKFQKKTRFLVTKNNVFDPAFMYSSKVLMCSTLSNPLLKEKKKVNQVSLHALFAFLDDPIYILLFCWTFDRYDVELVRPEPGQLFD
jgi:hypothetical protein